MSAGAFTPITRGKIAARAGDRCERCRSAGIEQYHHRRPRAMGGSKRPSTASAANGLALCAPCHGWIESNRDEAGRLGYLVSQSWEPADVSVFRDGQWVFFDDQGGVSLLPEEAD